MTTYKYSNPVPATPRKQQPSTNLQELDNLRSQVERGIQSAANVVSRLGSVAAADVQAFQEPVLYRAHELSRRVRVEAEVAAMNRAMGRFWMFTWEKIDGTPVGFGPTGLIHIGVPWSWRQNAKYGLHRPQADLLAKYVNHWTSKALDATRWTPIYYNKEATRWFVNLRDFQTYESGIEIMAKAVQAGAIAKLLIGIPLS